MMDNYVLYHNLIKERNKKKRQEYTQWQSRFCYLENHPFADDVTCSNSSFDRVGFSMFHYRRIKSIHIH